MNSNARRAYHSLKVLARNVSAVDGSNAIGGRYKKRIHILKSIRTECRINAGQLARRILFLELG